MDNAKPDLEIDLLKSSWLVDKVRNCEMYSQNLYAALCNNQFIKLEMWFLLKNHIWSCSWRYAGEILTKLRNEQGSYMDWYCSGITGDQLITKNSRQNVGEGTITSEVAQDLKLLGWRAKD